MWRADCLHSSSKRLASLTYLGCDYLKNYERNTHFQVELWSVHGVTEYHDSEMYVSAWSCWCTARRPGHSFLAHTAQQQSARCASRRCTKLLECSYDGFYIELLLYLLRTT